MKMAWDLKCHQEDTNFTVKPSTTTCSTKTSQGHLLWLHLKSPQGRSSHSMSRNTWIRNQRSLERLWDPQSSHTRFIRWTWKIASTLQVNTSKMCLTWIFKSIQRFKIGWCYQTTWILPSKNPIQGLDLRSVQLRKERLQIFRNSLTRIPKSIRLSSPREDPRKPKN